MEEYGNNGSYGVNWKQMRAVDGKQEIYLEWPNRCPELDLPALTLSNKLSNF